MLAVTFFSVVLWIHILAVVVALGGVFTYPVWFAIVGRAQPAQRAFFHEAQARIGERIITPGLGVILLAGIYLASKEHAWSEPWVIVPLLILLVLGGLGGAFFGPREARLAALAGSGDEAAYRALFAQVRTVSFVAMGLVVIAIYFMTAKPFA